MRPKMVAKTMFVHVFVRMRCSQTIGLRASCRPYARIRDSLARATACVVEMPFPVLAVGPLLYLLDTLLDTSLGVIPVVGTIPEFDSLGNTSPEFQ